MQIDILDWGRTIWNIPSIWASSLWTYWIGEGDAEAKGLLSLNLNQPVTLVSH